MRKILAVAVIVVAILAVLSAFVTTSAASHAAVHQEKVMHPRIARAIHELQDAVVYMERAPDEFGGHKAAAIAASKAAIEQLRVALEYRADKDAR